MADYENAYRTHPARTDAEGIDQGLRTYMLGVYNYMALGVALTGVIAWVLSNQPEIMAAIWTTPLKWLVVLAPLPVALYVQWRIDRISGTTAQGLFWLYAALVGVSLSLLFAVYTGTSIARVFFITAISFGALSLYGYTTKRDLSGMATFLVMGLFGVIIASIVNIFLGSSTLQWIVSIAGLLVFAGFTAYDTQDIKNMYDVNDDGTVAGRKSVMGALRLYLDFLNIFLFLLQLLGNRE